MTENTSILCSVMIDSYAPSKYSLNYLIITSKLPIKQQQTNKKKHQNQILHKYGQYSTNT